MNCKHLTGVSLAECIAATLRSICSQASELLAKYRREIRLYLSLLQLLKVLGTIMSSHLVLKYYVNNVGLAVNYMDYGCHISDYCRLFSCPYFTDVGKLSSQYGQCGNGVYSPTPRKTTKSTKLPSEKTAKVSFTPTQTPAPTSRPQKNYEAAFAQLSSSYGFGGGFSPAPSRK